MPENPYLMVSEVESEHKNPYLSAEENPYLKAAEMPLLSQGQPPTMLERGKEAVTDFFRRDPGLGPLTEEDYAAFKSADVSIPEEPAVEPTIPKRKLRTDGTEKGPGFLGTLQRPDGKISTELSIGVNLDGKETEIPCLVPTLEQGEVDYLLGGGKPTETIVQKAVDHARTRIGKGESPFAQKEESPYGDIINRASQAHNIEPDLIKAIIGTESSGDPEAVSSKGAGGLMQLMPETAKMLGVKNSLDPEQNIMGGTKYLRQMLDKFDGDETLALAAYNAGPGNVTKYGGVPPFPETQEYIRKISERRKPKEEGEEKEIVEPIDSAKAMTGLTPEETAQGRPISTITGKPIPTPEEEAAGGRAAMAIIPYGFASAVRGMVPPALERAVMDPLTKTVVGKEYVSPIDEALKIGKYLPEEAQVAIGTPAHMAGAIVPLSVSFKTASAIMKAAGLPTDLVLTTGPVMDQIAGHVARGGIAGAIYGGLEGGTPQDMAEDAAFFGVLEGSLGAAGKIFKKLFSSNWYRNLEVKERGLVVQSADDLLRAGHSEGTILRTLNDPAERTRLFKAALQKRKASVDLTQNRQRFEENPLDAANNAEYLDKYIQKAKQPKPHVPVVPGKPIPIVKPAEMMKGEVTTIPKPVPELPSPDWEVMKEGKGVGVMVKAEKIKEPAVKGEGREFAKEIDTKAQEAATSPLSIAPEPTEAQIEMGNYKKGHIKIQGLDISIENPKGSERKGIDPSGKKWSVTMKNHYGYIKGTVGKDKEHLDVFVGDNPESKVVFVVDQVNPETRAFDEHKIIVGTESIEEAQKTYLDNYEKGWNGLGDISEMKMDHFKEWIESGNTKKPFNLSVKEKKLKTISEKVKAETPGMLKESDKVNDVTLGTLVDMASEDPAKALEHAAEATVSKARLIEGLKNKGLKAMGEAKTKEERAEIKRNLEETLRGIEEGKKPEKPVVEVAAMKKAFKPATKKEASAAAEKLGLIYDGVQEFKGKPSYHVFMTKDTQKAIISRTIELDDIKEMLAARKAAREIAEKTPQVLPPETHIPIGEKAPNYLEELGGLHKVAEMLANKGIRGGKAIKITYSLQEGKMTSEDFRILLLESAKPKIEKPKEPVLREPEARYRQSELDVAFGGKKKADEAIESVAKEVDKVSRRGMPDRVAGEPAKSKVAEEMRKNKRVDLTGRKLTTGNESQEIAELFQVYRSPKMEILHAIYTSKDGTILGHNAITSGNIGAVNPGDRAKYVYRMKSVAKRLGAAKVHILHNHPSGDATMSRADLGFANGVRKKLGGLYGEFVVIDHGKFTWVSKYKRENSRDYAYTTEGTYKVTPGTGKWMERKGPLLKSPQAVAGFGNSLAYDKTKACFVYVDGGNNVVGWSTHDNKILEKSVPSLEKILRQQTKGHGAAKAIIITEDMALLEPIAEYGNVENWLLDALALPAYAEGKSLREAVPDAFRIVGKPTKPAWGLFEPEVPYAKEPLSETKSRLLENIKAEKGTSELINDLSRLGADAIKRGHTSFKAFSVEMKAIMGNAWAKVKDLVRRAYRAAKKTIATVKKWNEKPDTWEIYEKKSGETVDILKPGENKIDYADIDILLGVDKTYGIRKAKKIPVEMLPKIIKSERGLIGGVKAKGAPTGQLARAQEMLAEGKDKNDIWRETGWMKGAEKKDTWKFEIDDSDARIKSAFKDDVESSLRGYQAKHDRAATLEEVINHPKIFKAYPELKNITVGRQSELGGHYAPGAIFLGPKSDLTILLHEIQHAIQEIEGFARGGSPEAVLLDAHEAEIKTLAKQNEYFDDLLKQEDKLIAQDYSRISPERTDINNKIQSILSRHINEKYGSKSPELEYYKRLAGEIEAREVATRKDLTKEQRRIMPPYAGAGGIPQDQWIVIDGKGTSFSVEAPSQRLSEPKYKGKPRLTQKQKEQRAKKKAIKEKQLKIENAEEAKKQVHAMIRDRRQNLNLSAYDTNLFVNDIEQQTSKVQREIIPFIIEKTDIPKSLNRPDLEKAYKKDKDDLTVIARQVKEHFDASWLKMKKNIPDMSVEQIENYVTHIWDLNKDQKRIVTNWFTTQNRFLKKRYIETLKEGIDELGLTPKVLDIGEIIRIHDGVASRAIENVKFVEGLKGLKHEGMSLIARADLAPQNWVYFDHPALRRGLVIPGTLKMGEKVSPELSNLLAEMGVAIGRRISPVAFGKPVGNAGEYRPGEPPEVRFQKFMSNRTIAHEIGHHLDETLGLGYKFLNNYASELYAINRERIESRVGKVGKYGEAYARSTEEQIAEFFATLFTDASNAYRIAPNATADALNRLRQDEVLSKLIDFDFEKQAKNLIEEQVSTLVKLPIKVHPDLEKPLKVIFESRIDHPAIQAYEVTNGILKKTNLSLSLFHHGALGETGIPIMGPGKFLNIYFNPVKIYKAMTQGKFDIFEKEPLAKDAIAHGLQVGATADIPVNVIQSKLNNLARMTKNTPLINRTTEFVRTFNEVWDKALWNYLHDTLKLYAYESLVSKVNPAKNVTKQKQEITQFINDTFGGQNWDTLMVSPKTLQIMTWTLLSADWTTSTVRQALSPTGIGKVHKETAGLRRKLGAYFWIKAGLYFGAGINMLNYTFRERDEKENPKYYEGMGKRTFLDKTMAGNTMGHKTHLFVGRHEDGTERYIRWGKQFRELPELFFDDTGFSPISATFKKVGGKLAPMIQLTSKITTGTSPSGFRDDDIYGKKGWDRVYGMGKVLIKSPLPFATRALFQKDKKFHLTDLAMPSSKGMTRWKSINLFKHAITKRDDRLLKETYQFTLMNNLPAYTLFSTALTILKAESTREFNEGVKTIEDVKKMLDKVDNPKDLIRLGNKLERTEKENIDRKLGMDLLDQAIEDIKEYEVIEGK